MNIYLELFDKIIMPAINPQITNCRSSSMVIKEKMIKHLMMHLERIPDHSITYSNNSITFVKHHAANSANVRIQQISRKLYLISIKIEQHQSQFSSLTSSLVDITPSPKYIPTNISPLIDVSVDQNAPLMQNDELEIATGKLIESGDQIKVAKTMTTEFGQRMSNLANPFYVKQSGIQKIIGSFVH